RRGVLHTARARRSGLSAAGGDDADHALEREDGVALGTLDRGIRLGKHLDAAAETVAAPPLQVALGTVDLPRRHAQLLRELTRATPRTRDLRHRAELHGK